MYHIPLKWFLFLSLFTLSTLPVLATYWLQISLKEDHSARGFQDSLYDESKAVENTIYSQRSPVVATRINTSDSPTILPHSTPSRDARVFIHYDEFSNTKLSAKTQRENEHNIKLTSTLIIIILCMIFSVFITRLITHSITHLIKSMSSINTKNILQSYSSLDESQRTSTFYELNQINYLMRKMMEEFVNFQKEMESQISRQYRILEKESKKRKSIERQKTSFEIEDSLTSLPRKCLLKDRIKTAIDRNIRTKHKTALILINISGIDNIYEQYGEIVGDSMIVNLSKTLSKEVRAGDTLSRYSKQKFALLLCDVQSQQNISTMCERLIIITNTSSSYVNTNLSENPSLSVSSTIGAAIVSTPNTSPEQLMMQAEHAKWGAERNLNQLFYT